MPIEAQTAKIKLEEIDTMSAEDLIRLKSIDKARRQIQQQTALAMEARHKSDLAEAQKHEAAAKKQEERVERLKQERAGMKDELKRQKDIREIQQSDRKLKVHMRTAAPANGGTPLTHPRHAHDPTSASKNGWLTSIAPACRSPRSASGESRIRRR